MQRRAAEFTQGEIPHVSLNTFLTTWESGYELKLVIFKGLSNININQVSSKRLQDF